MATKLTTLQLTHSSKQAFAKSNCKNDLMKTLTVSLYGEILRRLSVKTPCKIAISLITIAIEPMWWDLYNQPSQWASLMGHSSHIDWLFLTYWWAFPHILMGLSSHIDGPFLAYSRAQSRTWKTFTIHPHCSSYPFIRNKADHMLPADDKSCCRFCVGNIEMCRTFYGGTFQMFKTDLSH